MSAKFTKEMKETHTILIPTMIEPHFSILLKVIQNEGYNAVLLENDRENIIEEGLKAVHNDMCYPALLVIGQFMNSLKSGKFDTHKVALLISQTGGGCRASNYINLLRKALEYADMSYIPVVSLNFSSLDDNAFVLSKKALFKSFAAVYYGDMIMCLYNQCKPYEKIPNQTDEAYQKCVEFITSKVPNSEIFRLKKNYKFILNEFKKIELKGEKKVKVGIVGEIYLKYSPLANNNLNHYLIKEGAEPVNTGLMDFALTSVYDAIYDKEIYGRVKSKTRYYASILIAKILEKLQNDMIKLISSYGFRAPTPFKEVRKAADGYISHGVKMGEGWLLTAEMVEFMQQNITSVVCAQPFGCLPNHIIARGMVRKIKDNFPHANIATIDYDPGASSVNQENRIKLMLANAKEIATVANSGNEVQNLKVANA
ncbi:MAG: 2-hydroxyacyl-CoA dehydratase [Campylobacter sp.]|nr:2-hydroxyacyl-CoA dehydratase [Campylobacter sp.]